MTLGVIYKYTDTAVNKKVMKLIDGGPKMDRKLPKFPSYEAQSLSVAALLAALRLTSVACVLHSSTG